MKELSIEEKAKRYDEAIKYGQYLINERCKEGTDGSFHRADLQKMFPELVESEDERIRKELLNYLYDVHDDDEERASWIAWLEKQGIDTLEDAILDSIEDGLIAETIRYKNEKQGEQKPAEQYDTNKEFSEAVSEKIRNMVSRLFNGDGNITSKEFADQFAWELLTLARYEIQKEQKPAAWSEEDESLCMQIEGLLKVCLVKNLLSFDLYKKMCDLLKSLKDRIQPQKEWKPSKEQIKAIRIARSFVISDNPILSELLVELEEQLKKLSEE